MICAKISDSSANRLRMVAVPSPIGTVVAQLVDDAIAKGMGDLDFLCLLPRLQVAAGVEPDLEGGAADADGS